MINDIHKIIDGYNCGLGVAFQVVSGKWKAIILWILNDKPHRFGELKRKLPGISERILINQLKELEADGMILRHDFQTVPPRVEYSITEFGKTLCHALLPLSDWGLQHEDRIQDKQDARTNKA